MLIISYATDDNYYRGYYDKFRANLDEHGFEHDVRLIPTLGNDKVAACCYRPQFILDMLEEHKRPVFWVDADSVIHAPFEVDGEFDFAYCRNPQFNKRRGLPTITAGIFGFGNTFAAKVFLIRWMRACAGYAENRISSHTHLDTLHKESDARQLDFTESVKGCLTFYGTRVRYTLPV